MFYFCTAPNFKPRSPSRKYQTFSCCLEKQLQKRDENPMQRCQDEAEKLHWALSRSLTDGGDSGLWEQQAAAAVILSVSGLIESDVYRKPHHHHHHNPVHTRSPPTDQITKRHRTQTIPPPVHGGGSTVRVRGFIRQVWDRWHQNKSWLM